MHSLKEELECWEETALNCEERCADGHDLDAYYAGKVWCEDCLVNEWWEELSVTLLEMAMWTGETDEQDILDRCTYEVKASPSGAFTGFYCTTQNQADGGRGVVSIEALEKLRNITK